MNISGPDPSGALGKLFFPVHQKEGTNDELRVTHSVSQNGTNDEVSLSSFAHEVRNLSERARHVPDVRTDRLQEVRTALDRQELASSQQVADAIVRDTVLNSLSLA
ncbi:MAG: flagellar biosynthesis anti-sigma factor FlgM [Nitrospirae bacterium]|nr:MAG: flagellar biosynthesis anti-sigma factor FlgM [Nitrospirota bacterium]